MNKKNFQPESLMMSYGYIPELSEGALKCPIFQTSTFTFKTAEEGKAFFEVAYGHRKKYPTEELGLIYSRLNNPNLEILENRLKLWDKAEDCAVFDSGMSAISTIMLEFLKPGDVLLFSSPLYGGTDYLIKYILPKFGIEVVGFKAGLPKEKILDILNNTGKTGNLALIFMETPSNPTNELIDIAECREISTMFSSKDKEVLVVVDNTFMGPLWQHPLEFGAHLVVYSATKYIGGHSDAIAGACLGPSALITRIKTLRTFLGNMAGPWTGWLLLRSLETLKMRMEAQAANAIKVAEFLNNHPRVEKVNYLGFITEDEPVKLALLKKQYSSYGAMISFYIQGGEKEAFNFLNRLRLIKMAVSLGSTGSLAEHPASMTHSDMSSDDKNELGITANLVRISVGVENFRDLIWDIKQALDVDT